MLQNIVSLLTFWIVVSNESDGEQKETSETEWPNLPDALENVFSFLPWGDRFSSSLVCRPWNYAFKRPSLWKEANFVLGKNSTKDGAAFKFCDKYGSTLTSLKLVVDEDAPRSFLKRQVVAFFEKLIVKGTQLEKLKLEVETYVLPPELNDSFSRFLKSQKKLKHLDLESITTSTYYDGFKVLTSAFDNGKDSIETLKLSWFFNELYLDETSRPTLINILSTLKKLRFLTLSYVDLDAIKGITPALSPKIQQFEVSFSNGRVEALPPSTIQEWDYLIGAYREMKVSYEYTFFELDQTVNIPLDVLLPEKIILTELTISFSEEDSTVVKPFLEYVGDKFSLTIESLRLYSQDDEISERKSEEIISFLKKLRLRKLKVDGMFPPSFAEFVNQMEKLDELKIKIRTVPFGHENWSP